ncbi:ABC transporter permease [Streptomyces sp. MST-110588]|uniref:ABC transporter permease n=1 Tax=Streptomyces sp. MST-110588 TaxID=2833628 RepID=UPI001F5C578F|nr:ABC transporter permease [Streptomyces sp. MST-110588]
MRRLIAYEVLVVTVVAAVPGAGLGALLAFGLLTWLSGQGFVPGSLPLVFGPVSVLIAVAVCWVTAEAAVWSSGRRASRVRALQALGEAAVPRRAVGVVRTGLGLAVLAGGVWGLAALSEAPVADAAGTAGGMVMVLMVAVGLLAPWVGKLAGGVFGALCRVLFPVVGLLVHTNLGSRHRRLGAAATPLALTVAFAAVALFVPQMKWEAQHGDDQRRVVADRLVWSARDQLPVSATRTLRGVPGAGAAVGTLDTYATVYAKGAGPDDRKATPVNGKGRAVAVTDGPLSQVLDLAPRPRPIERLGRDEVALSENAARLGHLRVGDKVWLRMEDDRVVSARLAAVYARAAGFTDLLLPHRLATAHTMDERPGLDTVYVRARFGQEKRLAEGLAALAARHPDWQVQDRAGYRAQELRQHQASMAATYLLLAVITVFTSISVVNTLVMTTMERTGEFALLRLVGATRRQVARMMRLENAVTVLAALLVGAAVGGSVLAVFSRALTGSPWPHLPGAATAVILGGAGLLAVATGVLTTRIALRQRPTGALRSPEQHG